MREMVKLRLPANERGLWRGFGAGIASIMFCAGGEGAFLFLMVSYLERQQVPVAEIGMLKALLSLVEGAVCLLVGFLYRGKHPRLITAAAAVTMALSAFMYAGEPTGAAVWVATALNGIGIGVLVLIPYVITLARRPSSISLGLGVGLFTAAIAAGNSVGAAVTGFLTDAYGFGTSFAVSGINMLLILVAAYFYGTETNTQITSDTPAAITLNTFRGVDDNRVWKLAIAAGFTLASVNVIFETLFPIFMLRSGTTIGAAGTFTGIKLLMAAIVRPFSGALMTRLNGLHLTNWGITALAAATVFMPLAGMGASLMILVAVMGLSFGAARVTTATLSLHGQNDPHLTSQRSSIYNTALSVGQIIGPWLCGIVAGIYGVTAALIGLPLAYLAFYGITSLALPRFSLSSKRIERLKVT
jgi:predicted MFS family arabinose efflux permease